MHIRLIYLVRSSQADHNMAIASASELAALDAFTTGLKVIQVPARRIAQWPVPGYREARRSGPSEEFKL